MKACLLAAFLTYAPHSYADDVRIRGYYPIPYGEYAAADAEGFLQVGRAGDDAQPTIHGNLTTVRGGAVIKKSDAGIFRVCPGTGPYGSDGLRIDANENVSIGNDPVRAMLARLKVHTVIKGTHLRVLGDPAITPQVYGFVRAYQDLTQPTEHLRRKAQFCSLPGPAPEPTPGDPATLTYDRMRLEAKIVQFGPSFTQRTAEANAGVTGAVLIDAMEPIQDPYGTPELFLQVGRPLEVGDPPLEPDDPRMAAVEDPGGAGSGWREFSSRDYKKDIAPLGPKQHAQALSDIAGTNVVRYRFRRHGVPDRVRLGLIAEELPSEIRSPDGKTLNIAEAFAYAAAALKELKTRNDSLKSRIESLEKRKAALKS